jgi:saccharopine dehydrogenase-like NADP-dependent oxidoreductase
MNVILAGSTGACYYEDGNLRCVPYHRLFENPKKIEIPGFRDFEAYENRDSVSFRKKYGLDDIPTFIRATLRYPGFCEAWNLLIKLGLTADNYPIDDSEKMNYRDWVSSYLPAGNLNLENKLADHLGFERGGPLHQKLLWTDLLSERPINRVDGTPAEILLDLLLDKLKFNHGDTDMLVFFERIRYRLNGESHEHVSHLVTRGLDHDHTAISRTVGLPAAIGAKLILNGEIQSRGVLYPWTREVYDPVLDELSELGIAYSSSDRKLQQSVDDF